MDFFDVVSARRSVRQFKDAPVPESTVEKILSAAIHAPTAGNVQSWHFVVVRDEKIKHRLATEAGHQHFIHQAPVVIVVCADLERAERGYGSRGRELYSIQDTSAAVENMLLSVTALGLASCWIGAFDEKKAAEIIDLPENLRPVAMLPIGFAGEPERRMPPRRKMEEVVSYR